MTETSALGLGQAMLQGLSALWLRNADPAWLGLLLSVPLKQPLFHFHFCFYACNAPLCFTYFSVLSCLLLIFFLLPQLFSPLVLPSHSCSVCVSPPVFFKNCCYYHPWSALSDPHPSGTLNNVRSSTTATNLNLILYIFLLAVLWKRLFWAWRSKACQPCFTWRNVAAKPTPY